jgi:hypothetical protein
MKKPKKSKPFEKNLTEFSWGLGSELSSASIFIFVNTLL